MSTYSSETENSNMEKIVQVLISLIEEQEDVIIEYELEKDAQIEIKSNDLIGEKRPWEEH